MLTEGFLAVLVILACVAGLGLGIAGSDGSLALGTLAYEARYETWGGANSLAAKVGAFVEGSANFLRALGLNAGFAVALMGVFVASFAATTLDTACRLQLCHPRTGFDLRSEDFAFSLGVGSIRF